MKWISGRIAALCAGLAAAGLVVGVGVGLAPTVTAAFTTNFRGQEFAQNSLIGYYLPVMPAGTGGVTTLDNADINYPDSQINSAKPWILTEGRGTNCTIRVVYDPASMVVTTNPRFALYTRTNNSGPPSRLRNANADRVIQVTLDPLKDERFIDSNSGGAVMAASQVDLALHRCDMQAGNQLRVGVEQVLAVSAGTAATAYVVVELY